MAQSVEAVVWDHVKALLADPAVLQTQYEQGRGDPAVDVKADQERERIERKLTGLDREVSRLIDAYQAEVIEIAELSERRRRGEEQGRMLRQRLREMEQQRANRENEVRLLEGVEAFCASVRQSLEEPSFEVKQKVLQLVVDRIVVEESRVVIQHVVPTGPVRLQTEQLGQKTPLCGSCAVPSGRAISGWRTVAAMPIPPPISFPPPRGPTGGPKSSDKREHLGRRSSVFRNGKQS